MVWRIDKEDCVQSTHLGLPWSAFWAAHLVTHYSPGISDSQANSAQSLWQVQSPLPTWICFGFLAFAYVVHPAWTLCLLFSWPVHFLEGSSSTSSVFFMNPPPATCRLSAEPRSFCVSAMLFPTCGSSVYSQCKIWWWELMSHVFCPLLLSVELGHIRLDCDDGCPTL